MSIFDYSEVYTPVYPKLVEISKLHEEVHWHEGEVKLQQDVEDWKRGRLSEYDKRFIRTILMLFTESDVAVGRDYYDNLIPVYKATEARNMLGSFAAREGVHTRAYALLNDTLGFGENFYKEFLQYKEMKDKIDFMLDMRNVSTYDIAVSTAKQVLVEGVFLFAQFAMLLNYQRFGKLPGTGDVNQWSIRDESIHVMGLAELFNIVIQENPKIVTPAFKREIYETARQVVAIEDTFIDLVFDNGNPEGITREETKQYIRAVTDYRMEQLGFKKQFNVENPFEWLEWVTSSEMFENFFETNTTAYSKDSMRGDYAGGY